MLLLVEELVFTVDVVILTDAQILDGGLLFSDLLLELADLIYDLVELLLGLQQLRTDFARTDLGVQQFLILLFDLLHVLLVLDLQLVEVDELELVAHFFLLCYLVGSLDDLSRKSGLFVLVFLNQRLLLPVLLLEEFLDPLCLDVAGSTVLPAHQNLSLEVIGILPDFSDGHVGLLQNGPESFEDGVRFDSPLFDGPLQFFSLLLSNLVLFLGREVKVAPVFILLAGLLLFLVVVLVLVLLFKAHEVGLKEIVFSAKVFDVLEVAFKLLGELFDGEEFLALLGGFQLPLAHQLYKQYQASLSHHECETRRIIVVF
jgi:hypothetical protein